VINQQMFTIILDEAVKDDAIDIAMSLDNITGFTLSEAHGFSHQHAQYDIKEQVEGYRDLFRLDIIHEPAKLPDLLTAFTQLASRFKLKFWVTPLIEYGEI